MNTNSFWTIFSFEVRRRYYGMLIWIVFWALFVALIVAFYDSLAANTKELEALISALPPQLLKAFNIDVSSLATIEGMINSRFTTFSIIIGGIWAGWQGAQLIGKDENKGVLTWLVTQPVGRSTIYIAKLASLLIWFLLVNTVLMAITVLQVDVLTSVAEVPVKFFLLLGLGLTVYYSFLAIIGSLGSILWNEDKGRYLAIFVVMFSYLANILRSFDGVPDFVKYFALEYYFNPDSLAKSAELDGKLVVVALSALLVAVIAVTRFGRRDIAN